MSGIIRVVRSSFVTVFTVHEIIVVSVVGVVVIAVDDHQRLMTFVVFLVYVLESLQWNRASLLKVKLPT